MTRSSSSGGATPSADAGPRALARLFEPRGIAIAGASGDPTRPGGQTVRALGKYGYRGGIYPVNPKYPEIDGRRCYPSIDAIDGDCDLAVVALPAAQVPGVIEQCGRRGIGHAVVLGGGFRESGEAGAAIEQSMLAAARAHGVRIVGPNCLGLVSVQPRVFAAFGSLTREPVLAPGGVSAVIQSGGFGVSVIIRCALAGVGFRNVVASGNESDLGAAELMSAFVDDPQTRVILAYLEGVTDGRGFMDVARRALAAGKPIIVLKAGNTDQGRQAAASHTANLTGSYDIYQAAFRQCGVVEVDDIDEAADAALCFDRVPLPRGRHVALMGGSGGSAAVFADAADRVGLKLAPLGEPTVEVLKASLPNIGSLQNPVDYTAGYPREDCAEAFGRAYESVLNDPNIHALGLMFATAGPAQIGTGARLLEEIRRRSDKPIVTFSAMYDAVAADALARLRGAGIPVLPSPRRVAIVLGRMAAYAEALARRPQGETATRDVALPALPDGAVTLDEVESKAILAAAGIPVTREVLLPLEGATAPALKYPLALKIVSREIAHKSDIGGVRLNVSREDVPAVAAQIVAKARAAVPGARLQGVLAAEMVADGVEMIVGVVNDPGFGPVVAVGLGGVLAEVLRDVAYRVAPFGPDQARAMLAELRARKVLDGVRGRPACDVDALVDVLVRVSELAWAMRDRLAELDVNPVLVRPRGLGVVAADALVVLR